MRFREILIFYKKYVRVRVLLECINRGKGRRVKNLCSLPYPKTGRWMALMVEQGYLPDKYREEGRRRRPGPFQWKKGQKIRDIFQKKNALGVPQELCNLNKNCGIFV